MLNIWPEYAYKSLWLYKKLIHYLDRSVFYIPTLLTTLYF